jgi:hypothetical protein
MKKFQILALVLGLFIVSNASGMAFAGIPGKIVNERQQALSNRIHCGVQSGSLTKREAFRLRDQQRDIARYERISRADGNGLSPFEARKLDRMQDRLNRNIYLQKRDRQIRY